MLCGGKSGVWSMVVKVCFSCRWTAISKESPMNVPSCFCCCCGDAEELALGSYRIGRVRKSLPSACLRDAGTPSALRVEATSGSWTQVVL